MNEGYVYVLSNPAMPGLMKIGRSGNGGKSRASSIYQTGVPSPFKLEFEMYVSNCVETEALIHERLDSKRYNKKREFFLR